MYLKELRYYFSTPIAYIAIGIYLLTISLFLWVVPDQYNIPDSGFAQVDGLFRLSPWLFMLLCPAITMHLIAAERQNGTWAVLRSLPISTTKIVVEKFLAAWTTMIIALVPTIIHYIIVYHISSPVGNIDSAAFFCSWLSLVLLAGVFVAIGVLCSSLTKSQIIAFLLAALICFFMFYGFDLISTLIHQGKVANVVSWFSLNTHYASMARGVIDMADVVYFISIGVLCGSLSIYSSSLPDDKRKF